MRSVTDSTVSRLNELARQPLAPGEHGAAVLAAVGLLLPYDGYALIGLDPITGLRTFMLSRNGVGPSTRLARHEFGRPDVNLYSQLALRPLPVGVTNAADEEGAHSARMRQLLAPAGYTSELRLVLRDAGRLWGILWLVRSDCHRPFTPADAARAAALAPALTAVVRRFTVRDSAPPPPLDAAALVLAPDDSVSMTTATFGEWLVDLVAGGEDDVSADDALRTLFDASNAARRSGTYATSCLRTMSGRWAHLRAEPIETRPGYVAVTLAHATPRQVLPAFARWHGLTSREQEVVERVVAGAPTKQVARALGISRYTAEDHLRAVYGKSGYDGKEALVAALTG